MNIFVSVLSAVILTASIAIWPLRLISMRLTGKSKNILLSIRRGFRKIHIPLGIASIIVVIMHCQLAEKAAQHKSSIGAFLLLCLLILAATRMSRKLMPKHWLPLHRGVSFIAAVGTVVHIVYEIFFV